MQVYTVLRLFTARLHPHPPSSHPSHQPLCSFETIFFDLLSYIHTYTLVFMSLYKVWDPQTRESTWYLSF